jgi:hypothetical protein
MHKKIQYCYYWLRNTHRFTSPQFLRSASFLGGGRMYTQSSDPCLHRSVSINSRNADTETEDDFSLPATANACPGCKCGLSGSKSGPPLRQPGCNPRARALLCLPSTSLRMPLTTLLQSLTQFSATQTGAADSFST